VYASCLYLDVYLVTHNLIVSYSKNTYILRAYRVQALVGPHAVIAYVDRNDKRFISATSFRPKAIFFSTDLSHILFAP